MSAKYPYIVIENPAGLTDAQGFLASGVHCDVRGRKDNRLDLALVYSEQPCTAAALFTTNRVCAAPVRVSKQAYAAGGPFHGVVINSGNANAATGEQGLSDAFEMQLLAAEACGVDPVSMLVCSTGRIGRHLPMTRIRKGIKQAAGELSDTAAMGFRAGLAILTSDTREKLCSVQIETREGPVTIAGMAKGAGMVQPDMATILAFVTTDAAISSKSLQKLTTEQNADTFNAITVDGDCSTNDTLLILANGASGIQIPDTGAVAKKFAEGLKKVLATLAEKIVGDGERISKVVEIIVEGGRSRTECEAVARAVGNSLLVKTSWYGSDPNWGRILDAAGYAGVPFDEFKLDLAYQPFGDEEGANIPVFTQGEIVSAPAKKLASLVARDRFGITLNLNRGKARYRFLSTDLTEGYVDFNKSE